MITLPVIIARQLTIKCAVTSLPFIPPEKRIKLDRIPDIKKYESLLIGKDSNDEICSVWGIDESIFSVKNLCFLLYQDNIHFYIQEQPEYYIILRREKIASNKRRYVCIIINKNCLHNFLTSYRLPTQTIQEHMDALKVVSVYIGNTPYNALSYGLKMWRKRCQ